jgi:hypothetical protein
MGDCVGGAGNLASFAPANSCCQTGTLGVHLPLQKWKKQKGQSIYFTGAVST